jgi:hypothetical protein
MVSASGEAVRGSRCNTRAPMKLASKTFIREVYHSLADRKEGKKGA